ncbi:MAG: 2-C-methyl-D-erythritol 2,4-cyclodiphosphate synthase [Bacillota bacterium]
MRVGIGYDVHRLAAGEELILGGVKINHQLGLEGHSDADVLVHAIMDSLLGAVGAGDIGQHFPDSDETYENISSLQLLTEVVTILKDRGYQVNNLDATVIAQAPKVAPYLEEMKEKIANLLGISLTAINLKATTTEKLGFIGAKEGIAAQAIASVERV